MSLISEIHNQHLVVRRIMYGLAVTMTLGGIGFFWFTSIERNMFFAIHPDTQERQEFLARQEDRMPRPLAAISKGFGSMTASIGSLLGFQSSRGFDKSSSTVHHDAIYLLPLAK